MKHRACGGHSSAGNGFAAQLAMTMREKPQANRHRHRGEQQQLMTDHNRRQNDERPRRRPWPRDSW